MAYFSAMKNAKIICEVAYKLTNEFREEHAEIPRREIIGMRHVLVHGYATVTPNKLYITVTANIPSLKLQIAKLLEDIDTSINE